MPLSPPTVADTVLARRLDAARRSAGLSVAALARLSGVPLSVAQKLLGGASRRPSLWTVAHLAVALDLSLDAIVERATTAERTALAAEAAQNVARAVATVADPKEGSAAAATAQVNP